MIHDTYDVILIARYIITLAEDDTKCDVKGMTSSHPITNAARGTLLRRSVRASDARHESSET